MATKRKRRKNVIQHVACAESLSNHGESRKECFSKAEEKNFLTDLKSSPLNQKLLMITLPDFKTKILIFIRPVGY